MSVSLIPIQNALRDLADHELAAVAEATYIEPSPSPALLSDCRDLPPGDLFAVQEVRRKERVMKTAITPLNLEAAQVELVSARAMARVRQTYWRGGMHEEAAIPGKLLDDYVAWFARHVSSAEKIISKVCGEKPPPYC